jgi:hypothetical protein
MFLIVLVVCALAVSLNNAPRYGTPFLALRAEQESKKVYLSLRRRVGPRSESLLRSRLGHASVKLFTWKGWYAVAAFNLLICVAGYGTGLDSPLPWRAALLSYRHGGTLEAILAGLSTTLADIWLLWMPANLFLARWRGNYLLMGRSSSMRLPASDAWIDLQAIEAPGKVPSRDLLDPSRDPDEWIELGHEPWATLIGFPWQGRFLFPEISLRLLNLAVGLLLMTRANPAHGLLKWFGEHSDGSPD